MQHIITGESTSRLSELKRYKVTNVFAQKYIGGGSFTSNGVDYNSSSENNVVVYYIDGIKYRDIYKKNGIRTTFEFTPHPMDVTDGNLVKKHNMGPIIGKPKVSDDVFITRQETSAFNDIFLLENIDNLSEITTFAGSNYFNVIQNS